jgi:hypothetical protein
MDPDFLAQGMDIQISGIATGAEGTHEVAGIDAEYIDLRDSPGYRSPNIFVSVAHNVVEITSETGRTIIGGDILAHVFWWERLDLLAFGGKDGDTIFAKHPHVGVELRG